MSAWDATQALIRIALTLCALVAFFWGGGLLAVGDPLSAGWLAMACYLYMATRPWSERP